METLVTALTTQSSPIVADQVAPLCSMLVDGSQSLERIVVALGASLTSPEDAARTRGTTVLRHIVESFATDAKPSEIALLTSFFIDRMRDLACVVPVLEALASMAAQGVLLADTVPSVFRTLLDNVRLQSLPQAHRACAYTLLEALLSDPSLLEALRPLGADFVVGFIQLVDQEKDPRNLASVFRMAPLVIAHFPAYRLFAEDLFDVLAAYFPIRYTPPAEDTSGITEDQLRAALRQCLVAGGLVFGEHAIPLIAETLQGVSIEGRCEALRLISDAAEAYSAVTWTGSASVMWPALRECTLLTAAQPSGEPSAVTVDALNAIRAVSQVLFDSDEERALFAGATALREPQAPLHHHMIHECARLFREPDLASAMSAARVLAAIASASPLACANVFDDTCATLHMRASETNDVSARTAALEILVLLMRATAVATRTTTTTTSSFGTEKCTALVREYAERGAQLFAAALVASSSGDDICVSGARGLAALLSCADGSLFDQTACQGIVTALLARSTRGTASETVRKEAVLALCSLASLETSPCCALIAGETLTVLFRIAASSSSSDSCAPMDTSSDAEGASMDATEALHALCLLSRASTTLAQRTVHHLTDPSLTTVARLQSVVQILSSPTTGGPVAIACHTDILPRMRQLCTDSKGHDSDEVAETAASVYRECVRWLNSDTQQQQGAVLGESGSMRILSALLCAARPSAIEALVTSAAVTGDEESDWIARLVTAAQTNDVAAQGLAALVNKGASTERVGCVIEQLFRELVENAVTAVTKSGDDGGGDGGGAVASKAIHLWAWFSKALVVSGHMRARDAVHALVQSMRHHPAANASQAFAVILGETPEALSRALHANWRIMYRQRLFVEHAAALHDLFLDSIGTRPVQMQAVSAVSHLLTHVPHSVVAPQLDRLLPLVLESLGSPDTTVVTQSLATLSTLLASNDSDNSVLPSSIEQHSGSFVTHAVQLASSHERMQVRHDALTLLTAIAERLPTSLAFPQRTTVLARTKSALNDPKRLVRKAAAQCRNAWFLLGK